jgi:hypothetical protein
MVETGDTIPDAPMQVQDIIDDLGGEIGRLTAQLRINARQAEQNRQAWSAERKRLLATIERLGDALDDPEAHTPMGGEDEPAHGDANAPRS